jgi:redox-sensitive bicupin YhaK (pirin superfamily)
MINLRKANQRGHFDHGWLNTYHTFSFASYYDPDHMGFRSLRVMNDDRVKPGMGFGMHGHQDMEILTYVLEGGLAHKDSLGNGEVLRPGELQRMSAGTGIRHSEFNPSKDEPVHFYQIWMLPETDGLTPSYEQREFRDAERSGKLKLVAAKDAKDGALEFHTSPVFYRLSGSGERPTLPLQPGRTCLGASGARRGQVNGQSMEAGAARRERGALLELAAKPSDILLFDLAYAFRFSR